MAQDSARREAILSQLEAEKVRFVNLEFTDVVGMAKCVTIPVEQFPDCLEHGKWFDGSALEGFARVAESDMYLLPDLSTFAVLPMGVRPQTSGRRARLDAVNRQRRRMWWRA
jgi:glutamine synthetase